MTFSLSLCLFIKISYSFLLIEMKYFDAKLANNIKPMINVKCHLVNIKNADIKLTLCEIIDNNEIIIL